MAFATNLAAWSTSEDSSAECWRLNRYWRPSYASLSSLSFGCPRLLVGYNLLLVVSRNFLSLSTYCFPLELGKLIILTAELIDKQSDKMLVVENWNLWSLVIIWFSQSSSSSQYTPLDMTSYCNLLQVIISYLYQFNFPQVACCTLLLKRATQI